MRLHIFGASGSGVTTTGQSLAKKLKLEYFDSDDYFWKKTNSPFEHRQKPTDRNAKIKFDLQESQNWILGGSIFQWGDNIFPKFDLVIFLFLSPEIRIERLKKREFERFGNIINTDPKRRRQFEKFILWASDYDNNLGIANRNFIAHENWLRTISSPTLKIFGDFRTDQRVELIIERMRQEKLLPTLDLCKLGRNNINEHL